MLSCPVTELYFKICLNQIEGRVCDLSYLIMCHQKRTNVCVCCHQNPLKENQNLKEIRSGVSGEHEGFSCLRYDQQHILLDFLKC